MNYGLLSSAKRGPENVGLDMDMIPTPRSTDMMTQSFVGYGGIITRVCACICMLYVCICMCIYVHRKIQTAHIFF